MGNYSLRTQITSLMHQENPAPKMSELKDKHYDCLYIDAACLLYKSFDSLKKKNNTK